jgi:hypothetical protein
VSRRRGGAVGGARILFGALCVGFALAAAAPAVAEELVLVDLSEPEETLSGVLVDPSEEGLRLEVDGETRVIPYARIRKLRHPSDPGPAATKPVRLSQARSNVLVLDAIELFRNYALLSYERRLHDTVSVSVHAGFGAPGVGVSQMLAWNAGAQGRFFVFGSFAHGAFAGLEYMHWAGAPDLLTSQIVPDSVSAVFGYRRIFAMGLVLEGVVGPSFGLSRRDGFLARLNAGTAF